MTTKQVFFLAAFFYLAIAPWFFHPDLKVIFSLASRLSQGVIDIYSFVDLHPNQSLTGPFVYPPLAYFILGIIYLPLRLFAGSGFDAWLFSGNTNVFDPHIFRYIFLLKLPFVLLHLGIGQLLYSLSKNRAALWLWLFNPISIYVVGLQGQIDLLAVVCTVLSLKLFSTRPGLSAFMLGLGAAIKSYPLLLLPFLILYLSPSWWHRVKYFCIGLVPYALSILPFLTTPSFYSHTFASNLSQRLLDVYLPFLPWPVPAVPMALVCIWLWLAVSKTRPLLHRVFLAVTLLVVASVKIHPQWLLWPLPFLCLSFSPKHWYLTALVTVLLIPDNFLSVGLIAPLLPAVYELPVLAQLLPAWTAIIPLGFSISCLVLIIHALYDQNPATA